MKLQLQQATLTRKEKKSIQRIVEVLGGHWGQINLEKQYEYAERAIFRCAQKADETSDSYLARADVMWSQLIAKDVKIEDLQPYITLRGSQLSADDKKRVLLDVDASGTGKLSNEKVNAAIRMLGAGFFHDATGSKKSRGKVYDQSVLVAEGTDFDDSSTTLVLSHWNSRRTEWGRMHGHPISRRGRRRCFSDGVRANGSGCDSEWRGSCKCPQLLYGGEETPQWEIPLRFLADQSLLKRQKQGWQEFQGKRKRGVKKNSAAKNPWESLPHMR